MTGGLTRWGICCASCLNPLFPLRTGLPSNTSPLLVWAARIANPGHLQPLQGNTITLAHPDERYMYTEMWKYSGKHRFHEMKCEASKINCLETHSHYHACLYPGRVCTKPLEGTSQGESKRKPTRTPMLLEIRKTPKLPPHLRRGRTGGGGTHLMHGRSRMTIDLAYLQCRDGARRVFTDQKGRGRFSRRVAGREKRERELAGDGGLLADSG